MLKNKVTRIMNTMIVMPVNRKWIKKLSLSPKKNIKCSLNNLIEMKRRTLAYRSRMRISKISSCGNSSWSFGFLTRSKQRTMLRRKIESI